MFGALNRFISRLDSDSPSNSNSSGHGAFGFQVLRNNDADLAIEPWYDFVVGINGRIIEDPDPNLFAQEVRNCAGASVTLGLWNAKGSRLRTLQIPVPQTPPSLGLALQWTPLSSTEDVWHILDVAPNSPADQAGLLPYSDYIIGTPEGIVRGESGLGELVEDHISRPLDLYIHNHEYNLTRLLTITPSRHWGGSGLLGCVLGYGALHRLPAPLNEPPQAPGETLFETARFSNEEDRRPDSGATFPPPSTTTGSQDFITPATQFSTLTSPPLPPSSSSPGPPPSTSPQTQQQQHSGKPVRGAARPRPSRGAGSTMDDYFREGEEKSQELDIGGAASSPSKRDGGPPPPPRRAGANGDVSGDRGGSRSATPVPPPPKATAGSSEKEGQSNAASADSEGTGAKAKKEKGRDDGGVD